MTTAPLPAQPTDADLVARLRAGDLDALETIYDRYAPALATFAYSMLRSRERADDALHDAIIVATGRIGQLRDPSRLRPWLYAVVRSECLRALRTGKRESVLEEWHDPGFEDDAGDDLHRAEIASLVRDGMGGLSPKDREIVELSLQHDLDNAEIAAVLGVKPSHVTALTSRARKSLEQSLGTLLVARAGGEGCTELTDILSAWDGAFTPLWRKRIAKHIDGCAECSGERKRRFNPAAILIALPLIAIPVALRTRTLHDAQPVLAAYSQPLAAQPVELSEPVTGEGRPPNAAARNNPPTQIDGSPAWDYPLMQKRSSPFVWPTVAALLALLAAGGLWLALAGDDAAAPVPAVVVSPSQSLPRTTPSPSLSPSPPAPTAEPTGPATSVEVPAEQLPDAGPSSASVTSESVSSPVESPDVVCSGGRCEPGPEPASESAPDPGPAPVR